MGEVGIMLGVLSVLLIFYFAVLGLGIANYIITALSLYTLANRRQIANPWMAWLPFTNNWIIGSIVDCHDAQEGTDRKWRVLLLTLSLIFGIGFIVTYIALFIFMFIAGISAAYTQPSVSQAFAIVLPIYIIFFLIMLAGSTLGFCQMICLYKIYEVTVPNKALKYILLSLLVPLASALCLMKCKNSLYGIPKLQNDIVNDSAEAAVEFDTAVPSQTQQDNIAEIATDEE